MVQRLHIDLECDFCGVINGSVETHPHSPDGKALIETDACAACWAPYQEAFDRLRSAGRTQRVAENQRARAKKMAAAVGGVMTRRVEAKIPANAPVIAATTQSGKTATKKPSGTKAAASKPSASAQKSVAKKGRARKGSPSSR